ncbi:MAG: hypothetical protein EZS28_004147 [Streblomastix strix]|uniref:NrS-1 polymerase-like helicase domain-containing protein n=1 Tax=Streblomastix strix TaxID=222440 RepID=A0A5J4WZL3_9EUKA|nr:MAG: hypothetical protein EZS28_004147 [Streblomastix strix]
MKNNKSQSQSDKPKGIEVFVLDDSSNEDNSQNPQQLTPGKIRTELVSADELFGNRYPMQLRNTEAVERRRLNRLAKKQQEHLSRPDSKHPQKLDSTKSQRSDAGQTIQSPQISHRTGVVREDEIESEIEDEMQEVSLMRRQLHEYQKEKKQQRIEKRKNRTKADQNESDSSSSEYSDELNLEKKGLIYRLRLLKDFLFKQKMKKGKKQELFKKQTKIITPKNQKSQSGNKLKRRRINESENEVEIVDGSQDNNAEVESGKQYLKRKDNIIDQNLVEWEDWMESDTYDESDDDEEDYEKDHKKLPMEKKKKKRRDSDTEEELSSENEELIERDEQEEQEFREKLKSWKQYRRKHKNQQDNSRKNELKKKLKELEIAKEKEKEAVNLGRKTLMNMFPNMFKPQDEENVQNSVKEDEDGNKPESINLQSPVIEEEIMKKDFEDEIKVKSEQNNEEQKLKEDEIIRNLVNNEEQEQKLSQIIPQFFSRKLRNKEKESKQVKTGKYSKYTKNYSKSNYKKDQKNSRDNIDYSEWSEDDDLAMMFLDENEKIYERISGNKEKDNLLIDLYEIENENKNSIFDEYNEIKDEIQQGLNMNDVNEEQIADEMMKMKIANIYGYSDSFNNSSLINEKKTEQLDNKDIDKDSLQEIRINKKQNNWLDDWSKWLSQEFNQGLALGLGNSRWKDWDEQWMKVKQLQHSTSLSSPFYSSSSPWVSGDVKVKKKLKHQTLNIQRPRTNQNNSLFAEKITKGGKQKFDEQGNNLNSNINEDWHSDITKWNSGFEYIFGPSYIDPDSFQYENANEKEIKKDKDQILDEIFIEGEIDLEAQEDEEFDSNSNLNQLNKEKENQKNKKKEEEQEVEELGLWVKKQSIEGQGEMEVFLPLGGEEYKAHKANIEMERIHNMEREKKKQMRIMIRQRVERERQREEKEEREQWIEFEDRMVNAGLLDSVDDEQDDDEQDNDDEEEGEDKKDGNTKKTVAIRRVKKKNKQTQEDDDDSEDYNQDEILQKQKKGDQQKFQRNARRRERYKELKQQTEENKKNKNKTGNKVNNDKDSKHYKQKKQMNKDIENEQVNSGDNKKDELKEVDKDQNQQQQREEIIIDDSDEDTTKDTVKTAIYDQLRLIRLWQDSKKNITAIDALEQYNSLFEKIGVRFISQNPKIFSVFQGYKYLQLEEVNYTKIEGFLELAKDTISANDELIYEYLLNQFAFIVQNAGKKTETAIILQGLQGIGKNVFTNVLCELLAGYSSKNITDIDDFVGKFNAAIENKILTIANEMKNFGESRMSNMDAMKSIITEYSFVVNEKNIPKHEVENVVNMILVINNIFPIQIENNDRHYVVFKCNSVHRRDLAYFTNLCNSFDEEFYINLFTFFMTREISQFNPRNIPMTQAKKDIIRASKSKVDDIIIDHFKQFKDGVIISQVELWKPQDMVLKIFQLALNNICSQVWRKTNGQRKRFYTMKEEMVKIYKNMPDEDADEKKAEAQIVELEKQEENNEYI